jgi:hypothetical protein
MDPFEAPASEAPAKAEHSGTVGRPERVLAAVLVSGPLGGAATWAATNGHVPDVVWAGVAGVLTLAGLGAMLSFEVGWGTAALCAAGMAALTWTATFFLQGTPEFEIMAGTFRDLGVEGVVQAPIAGVVAAITVAAPKSRLGTFLGVSTAKQVGLLVGFQFLLPGMVLLVLGGLSEVVVARRERWTQYYMRDLAGNLLPTLIAIGGTTVGSAGSLGLVLALYGVESLMGLAKVSLLAHVGVNLWFVALSTAGLWVAGRLYRPTRELDARR